MNRLWTLFLLVPVAGCATPASVALPEAPLARAQLVSNEPAIGPEPRTAESSVAERGAATHGRSAVQDVDADAQERADLAAKAQNPIADLISLPLQNNTNFNFGPLDGTQNVLNIQPVYPFKLSEDWNLITRTILPVIWQPALVPGGSSDFGLGDTQFTAFFSPRGASKTTWGVGPVALIPTSTNSGLGAGEWGAGAGVIALVTPKPWVAGVLVQNVWSFGGTVNSMILQYFVNYNMAGGWYLVSAPIITADWNASSGNAWTIPFGGGVGKLFRVGKLPVNTSLQAYANVETPQFGPTWQLRFQLQFLFPK